MSQIFRSEPKSALHVKVGVSDAGYSKNAIIISAEGVYIVSI